MPERNFNMADECELDRLRRWAPSLRRSSAATRLEADQHGPAWAFYDLSIASSEAQAHQAAEIERCLARLLGEDSER